MKNSSYSANSILHQNSIFDLLAGIHLGGVRLRGDVLFDGPLDRWHGNVRDAAVIESFLELMSLVWIRHVVIQVNLQKEVQI